MGINLNKDKFEDLKPSNTSFTNDKPILFVVCVIYLLSLLICAAESRENIEWYNTEYNCNYSQNYR